MSAHAFTLSAAEAAERFVTGVLARSPRRLEARVCGPDGMPVLCAVEHALAALPRSTSQELVWLSGTQAPGRHRLQLRAFGADNQLLDEAVHELPV